MFTAAVITISDRSSAGLREDLSGPCVEAILTQDGYHVSERVLIPDDQPLIEQTLQTLADDRHIALIVTTGGTGFSPRDVTPEATLAVCERRADGIPEAMRAASMAVTPRAMLSRAAAGIRSIASQKSFSPLRASSRPKKTTRLTGAGSASWGAFP